MLWTVITSSHNLIDQLRHECLPHEYNYPSFWWSKLLVVRSIKQCAHCAQLNKMTSQCASILIASLSSTWHNITPSNFEHQNARWWYSWGKHSRHNWSIASTGDMNASVVTPLNVIPFFISCWAKWTYQLRRKSVCWRCNFCFSWTAQRDHWDSYRHPVLTATVCIQHIVNIIMTPTPLVCAQPLLVCIQ